jgi:hypothetical protein
MAHKCGSRTADQGCSLSAGEQGAESKPAISVPLIRGTYPR